MLWSSHIFECRRRDPQSEARRLEVPTLGVQNRGEQENTGDRVVLDPVCETGESEADSYLTSRNLWHDDRVE